MRLFGELRSELRNWPIVEMSLSVIRVALFPFPVRSAGENELPVSELEVNPMEKHMVVSFSPEYLSSMSTAKYFHSMRELLVGTEMKENKEVLSWARHTF